MFCSTSREQTAAAVSGLKRVFSRLLVWAHSTDVQKDLDQGSMFSSDRKVFFCLNTSFLHLWSGLRIRVTRSPTSATAAWRWYALTLNLTLNVLLFGLLNYYSFLFFPSLQCVWNVPPSATGREVGYSPVDPKLLKNIWNCHHITIKLLVGAVIPFTFNTLVYNLFSDPLRQLFPLLSLPYVQCIMHTLQLQNNLFSLCK